MKGLTAAQRRALEPVGQPGDFASEETLDFLIREGYARWQPDPGGGTVLVPTELGLIALRLPTL